MLRLDHKRDREKIRHKMSCDFRKILFWLCRDFDLPKRSTGSAGDVQLGNRIFERFQKLHMDPWSHTHSVLLPEPDRFVLHSYSHLATL